MAYATLSGERMRTTHPHGADEGDRRVTSRAVLVETLDDDGTPTGSMEKVAAHRPPGRLHRAFSLFAFTDTGEMVLQRRSSRKYHSPLLLTNTACGHPLPAEAPVRAVERRFGEELGGRVWDLREVGQVRYYVVDDRTGLAEYEHNHVFMGRTDPRRLEPDPAEVDEVVVAGPEALRRLRRVEPFTAWFDHVWGVAVGSFPPEWAAVDPSDLS